MEATPTRRAGYLLLVLVFGVAMGVAGTVLARRWIGPELLSRIRSEEPVEGRVLDKARESDRVLLKIETEQGVFLATFTEWKAEIDLLVDPGDTIELDVRTYQPFLADPAIGRVRKPRPPIDVEEPSPGTAVEADPQITEPRGIDPATGPQEAETPA